MVTVVLPEFSCSCNADGNAAQFLHALSCLCTYYLQSWRQLAAWSLQSYFSLPKEVGSPEILLNDIWQGQTNLLAVQGHSGLGTCHLSSQKAWSDSKYKAEAGI